MARKFQIAGYPSGFTEGPALVLVAQSSDDALVKAVAVLKARGCTIDAAALSFCEDKPRVLERWP